MTHLRKRMLEELERRNYTESTTRAYLATISDFAAYFHQSPEHLGPEHIREYIAYLFRERKLSDNTVNQRVGALRFLYVKTLKRNWSVEETPYPKKRFHLPTVLSQEEVSRLIAAALTPFHRTILMTLYATGVRRTELAHLKLTDVDSARMVLHVRGGKGRKDRDVMLRAASESAIVAVKFRPHRQCRMAVSGPLGRVKTGLGGYGDSFGQLASGKAYALIAPLKTGKTNACGRGLAARTRTFEIKLIFG